MKGYANLEFLFSGAVFIGLVVYAGILMGTMHAERLSDARSDIAMARSARLFHALFFTAGSPPDWSDPGSAESIGLMESPWTINSTKLDAFMGYCDGNYIALVQKFGRPFHVRVGDRECGRRMEGTRHVLVLDGRPVEVEVGAE